MMRALLLRLLFGSGATARGVTARALDEALHVDGIGLSRGERRLLTSRVLAALERIGFRL